MAIFVILTLGVVSILATQLFRAPGITFALSVKVSGVDMGLTDAGAVLRDIDADRITILRPPSPEGSVQTSNNLLADAATESDPRIVVDGRTGTTVKLETLAVSGTNILSFVQHVGDARLEVHAQPKEPGQAKTQLSLGWTDATVHGLPYGPDPTLTDSLQLALEDVTLVLDRPRPSESLAPPFPVRALRFETIDDNAIRPYSLSTVLEGRLQFFSYGVPLPVQDLEAGQLIRFTELNAELLHVTGDDTGLVLRFYGTSDDVTLGYSSTLRSTYPSAYDGLGAIPGVRVALSATFAVLVALIGTISIRGSGDQPLAAAAEGHRATHPSPAPEAGVLSGAHADTTSAPPDPANAQVPDNPTQETVE